MSSRIVTLDQYQMDFMQMARLIELLVGQEFWYHMRLVNQINDVEFETPMDFTCTRDRYEAFVGWADALQHHPFPHHLFMREGDGTWSVWIPNLDIWTPALFQDAHGRQYFIYGDEITVKKHYPSWLECCN